MAKTAFIDGTYMFTPAGRGNNGLIWRVSEKRVDQWGRGSWIDVDHVWAPVRATRRDIAGRFYGRI